MTTWLRTLLTLALSVAISACPDDDTSVGSTTDAGGTTPDVQTADAQTADAQLGDTAVTGDLPREDSTLDTTAGDACDTANPDHTVGLISCQPEAVPGYTLFAPLGASTAYLIDMLGQAVHSWSLSAPPGNSVFLLESGNLLVTGSVERNGSERFMAGGNGGLVEELDWAGNILWTYEYGSADVRLHHDIERLPNGNILMIAWEYKSPEEAVDAGRDPLLLTDSELWPDHIIEVEPMAAEGGNIVWEWHAWDHLIQDHDATAPNFGVVADHPELIDLNYTATNASADWHHMNSVAYNADLDQIVLSVHNFGEIWIIDHSTTTEEAAGHSGGSSGRGGDLLYRWGNPAAYDAGTRTEQRLFGQHDAYWIPEGLPGADNILIFNNGMGRMGVRFSTVDEITTPVNAGGSYTLAPGAAFGPADTTWQFEGDPPESFFSQNISGAQRLPGGNTLICSGANGTIFEVTPDSRPDSRIVWKYISPVTRQGVLSQGEAPGSGNTANSVFRAYRYLRDYPGLAGRDLTPGAVIEGD